MTKEQIKHLTQNVLNELGLQQVETVEIPEPVLQHLLEKRGKRMGIPSSLINKLDIILYRANKNKTSSNDVFIKALTEMKREIFVHTFFEHLDEILVDQAEQLL